MRLKDITSKDDLIVYGDEFFERSARAKRRKEQQWLLNLAFIAGDQLVKVNKQTGMLDRIDTEYDPEWVVRVVNNRVLPIFRAATARLIKNKPRPSAKAQSREESDIQAARAAVKLEEHHWTTLNLDKIHPEMVSWLVACGNCFYKQFWNPDKGERIVDISSGLNEEGLPLAHLNENGEFVEFTLGDTDLILRSPFNIYPEPGKTSLKTMRMIGDAEVMDVEEIEEIYGKEVSPEKDLNLVKISQAAWGYLRKNDEKKDLDNSAIVKELYILPCKVFPRGVKVVWANGVLLDFQEDVEELPFVHFGLIYVPGSFWYKDLIEDVIPLQRRWNALLSKIEMHNDYYNDPPIVVDPNSIDVDEWTSEPGVIITQRAQGERPFILPVPQLDPAILRELEILNEQFEIVPILHKVSYGKETPHAKSGVAINFLQEKDDDILRPLVEGLEAAYAEVFKRDFKLCQLHYEEDRGFAIVGEDNEVEWIEFKKANLDANIDVGVEPGSAMPKSVAAKQALVMDMLAAGFFTDPRTGQPDFAKALKYLEFGSVNEIYEESALDSNQAKRENEALKEGTAVNADYWHNHDAHIYEHNRMRKTAEFERLPEEIKQIIDNHVKQHLLYLSPPQQPGQPVPGQPEPLGQIPEQSAPEQPAPGQSEQIIDQSGAPFLEQINAFIQDLQANNPAMYQQLMAVPEDQRLIAAAEMMMQVSPPPPLTGASAPGQ